MKLKTLFILAFVTLVTSPAASAQVRGTYYSLYGQQLMQANQTLRLVADNPRYSDSEIIPCIRVTMILSFFDGPLDATSRLRPMRRVTREIELDPGEAASFDISPSLACGDVGLCPQVRDGVYVGVSVFATPVEGDPIPPRLTFNSTLALREWGRTIFTLPVTEKGFDPQPDPPVLH